ncbi:hypothetical protein [Streptomyces sp. NBC_00859]|uniref:hypothetical protein n=1 Tax=Streptomyces sp. NBC_00859 TaxID=2903682 RepID=UPI003865C2FB|nr:hypothetical protein OG584_21875 [Streptomyces sp. NBC_00859]
MDSEQARQVDALLRRLGVLGVVAPEAPERTAGAWRVYDKDDLDSRRDVTADTLAAVAAKFPDDKPGTSPTRGFIIPP